VIPRHANLTTLIDSIAEPLCRYVLVLEADGPVLASSITAASVALADAGIEMRDLVSVAPWWSRLELLMLCRGA
jgi:hypothetical protein